MRQRLGGGRSNGGQLQSDKYITRQEGAPRGQRSSTGAVLRPPSSTVDEQASNEGEVMRECGCVVQTWKQRREIAQLILEVVTAVITTNGRSYLLM